MTAVRAKAVSTSAAFITAALLVSALAPNLPAQCTSHWESARVLQAADGRPGYVESPAAVATKSGILLLGDPTFLWAERDAFDPAPGNKASDTAAYVARFRANFGQIGFVVAPNHSATLVNRPVAAVMRQFVTVVGEDGATRVVWFAPAHASLHPDSADGDVWYAERRNDEWTTPKLVFSADRLDWSGSRAALLIRGSDVHIVVGFLRGHTRGIAYVRRIKGRWTTTETPSEGLASQATAQLIGGDSLAVAFTRVGAPGVRSQTGQHVFLIRAAISDTIWPSPTPVHFSGLGGVWSLRMYGNPTAPASRALTLVWDRSPNISVASADTVYAMSSDDAGVTWDSPDLLSLPFKAATFAQAADTRGNVHLVVTTSKALDAISSEMYHAAFVNGKWTSLDVAIADTVAGEPTLSSIGSDSLLLAWAAPRAAHSGWPGAIAPVTKYATLLSACRSEP